MTSRVTFKVPGQWVQHFQNGGAEGQEEELEVELYQGYGDWHIEVSSPTEGSLIRISHVGDHSDDE